MKIKFATEVTLHIPTHTNFSNHQIAPSISSSLDSDCTTAARRRCCFCGDRQKRRTCCEGTSSARIVPVGIKAL